MRLAIAMIFVLSAGCGSTRDRGDGDDDGSSSDVETPDAGHQRTALDFSGIYRGKAVVSEPRGSGVTESRTFDNASVAIDAKSVDTAVWYDFQQHAPGDCGGKQPTFKFSGGRLVQEGFLTCMEVERVNGETTSERYTTLSGGQVTLTDDGKKIDFRMDLTLRSRVPPYPDQQAFFTFTGAKP